MASSASQEHERTGRRKPGRPTLSNEELCDIALDLFLERGFERTSMEAITAAAGMAKRTVYARYPDKEALFRAALTRAIEDWIVPVERLQAAETGDLEETLRAIGSILVTNVLSPAGLRLLRLTNAEAARMPEISTLTVQEGTGPTLAWLADLFERRLSLDAKSDSAEAAQAFLNLVVGGPANNAAWGMAIDPQAIERHVSYSVRLFLHGLLGESSGDATARKLLDQAAAKLAEARDLLS